MESKLCRKCRVVKPYTDFYIDRTHKWSDGYRTECKICARRSIIDRRRLRLHGVTAEHYDNMLARQNFVCEICKQGHVQALCLDHNHETGKVRGLLCKPCNMMIGKLGAKENTETLRQGAFYLEKYNG